jgi:hypothetical protein
MHLRLKPGVHNQGPKPTRVWKPRTKIFFSQNDKVPESNDYNIQEELLKVKAYSLYQQNPSHETKPVKVLPTKIQSPFTSFSLNFISNQV